MTQATKIPGGTTSGDADLTVDLLRQYGCGPVQFAGSADGLYERHLVFDGVIDPSAAGPRELLEEGR